MKFEKFINKAYFLLEQDENADQKQNAEPDPNLKDAAQANDQRGKETESKFNDLLKMYFNITSKLIDIFPKILQSGGVNVNENATLSKFIKDLNEIKSAGVVDPKQGLDRLESIVNSSVDSYSSDIVKKPQPSDIPM